MTRIFDIGTERQLFLDDLLLERQDGSVCAKVQQPKPQEIVLVTDSPWEGNTSGYYTLFGDGDGYRMYYRGSHFDEERRRPAHREVTCLAESRDGVVWTKPCLGLFDFEGSRDNNIVWDGVGCHNFTPFIDGNPNCEPDARYKALGRQLPSDALGLYVFKSADGIRWSLIQDLPVITRGAFDSQNLAFWDPVVGSYACYYRAYRNGIRDIMVAHSDNLLEWGEPKFLQYPGAPTEHLYTNAIRRYERAPQYLIGFPTRFDPDTAQTEPLFMSSRDGLRFKRWAEPIIPYTSSAARGGNRSNYMEWGLLRLPHHDNVFSVYALESYYTGTFSRLRRFTYRVDGFVALSSTGNGEVLTKPLTFDGDRLELNFKTSKAGQVKLELQTADGAPIPRFTLSDCHPLSGDHTGAKVEWVDGPNLSQSAGQPIRLRVILRDADLYSFRFQIT